MAGSLLEHRLDNAHYEALDSSTTTPSTLEVAPETLACFQANIKPVRA
jgi:hypothetical protein